MKFNVKTKYEKKLLRCHEPTHDVNDQWSEISDRGVKCQDAFANGLIYVM